LARTIPFTTPPGLQDLQTRFNRHHTVRARRMGPGDHGLRGPARRNHRRRRLVAEPDLVESALAFADSRYVVAADCSRSRGLVPQVQVALVASPRNHKGRRVKVLRPFPFSEAAGLRNFACVVAGGI